MLSPITVKRNERRKQVELDLTAIAEIQEASERGEKDRFLELISKLSLPTLALLYQHLESESRIDAEEKTK